MAYLSFTMMRKKNLKTYTASLDLLTCVGKKRQENTKQVTRQKNKKTKRQKDKKRKKTKRQKDRLGGKHVWTVGRPFCAWILPFPTWDAHVPSLCTRIAAKNPTNGKFLTQQCSFSCTNSFKARSKAAEREHERATKRRRVGTTF